MKTKLLPGDIIFSRKKGPMSWSIRFLQGRFMYSHSSLVGDPVSVVYTTGFGGKGKRTWGFLPASEIRQVQFDEYLANKKYEIRRYDGLTDKQRQVIISWCQQNLNRKYPFRKSLMLLSGKNYKKIPVQPDLYHCYELVARAYKEAGIELNPAAGNTDPSGYDIREIYQSPKLRQIYRNY